MDIHNIKFKKPEFKKTYYISHTDNMIVHNMTDISIKKISKLQNDNGYIFSLNLTISDENFFAKIDDIGKTYLLENNSKWFANSLEEDDIKDMYNPSFCSQSNTINVYLPKDLADIKTKIKLNNKISTVSEIYSIINDQVSKNKHTINVELKHIGMYIYTDQTINRWAIKTINVHNIEDVSSDTIEEIEQSWKELVKDCDKILEGRKKIIIDTQEKLQNNLSNLLKEKNPKKWESKVQDLKELIQNIIF